MIEYRWSFDGYPGDSLVTFELSPKEGGTRLRLTARILESFPDGIPEFTRESALGGWTHLIRQSQKEFLSPIS